MTIWRAAPLRQDSRVPRLPPTPGLVCPAIRRHEIDPAPPHLGCEDYGLIEPALVAEAHHFLYKDCFLFVVETH